MSGSGWLGFLIVGLIARRVAEKVMKRGYGLVGNLVVAIVGSIVLRAIVGAVRDRS